MITAALVSRLDTVKYQRDWVLDVPLACQMPSSITQRVARPGEVRRPGEEACPDVYRDFRTFEQDVARSLKEDGPA